MSESTAALPVTLSSPNNATTLGVLQGTAASSAESVETNAFGDSLMIAIDAVQILAGDNSQQQILPEIANAAEPVIAIAEQGNEALTGGNTLPLQPDVLALNPTNVPGAVMAPPTTLITNVLPAEIKKSFLLATNEDEKEKFLGGFIIKEMLPDNINLPKANETLNNSVVQYSPFQGVAQESVAMPLKNTGAILESLKNSIPLPHALFQGGADTALSSLAAGTSSTLGPQAVGGTNQSPAVTSSPLSIQASFYSQEWGEEMGQKIVWMVKNDMQSAELRVNPPHLGPIEIRIAINNDQTSITLSSQHAPVRESLEAGAPRLKELFTEAGLNLANVDISKHSFAEQREQQKSSQYSSKQQKEEDSSLPTSIESSGNIVARGMIDYFA